MSPMEWDAFVRASLVEGWLQEYDAMTPWAADVMEISLGALTYLFDGTPTMSGAQTGDDRVVAVWGHSVVAQSPRERARQAGFIRVPEKWSHRGMDRGHFVAHAAGGGLDMNFFPQAKGLNRGTTERGKVWKAMNFTTKTGKPVALSCTCLAQAKFSHYCRIQLRPHVQPFLLL